MVSTLGGAGIGSLCSEAGRGRYGGSAQSNGTTANSVFLLMYSAWRCALHLCSMMTVKTMTNRMTPPTVQPTMAAIGALWDAVDSACCVGLETEVAGVAEEIEVVALDRLVLGKLSCTDAS